MDNRKTIVARNISRIVKLENNSLSEFARRANMSPPTLTTFLKYPEDRNITLDHMYSIADIAGFDLWNLFIPDFPFQEVRATAKRKSTRIFTISADGYALLHAFESAPNDMVRYAMLDSISHSLCKVDESASNQIKALASRYLEPPK